MSRVVDVTLYVNDGQGFIGASNSITTKMADVGDISWSLDEQLTKVSLSSLAIKVWDEDGAVWTWLEDTIGTTVLGSPQLFPPWIVVKIGSTKLFEGFIDLATINRDVKEGVIELSAQDWSVMLRDIPLEAAEWSRPYPKVISTRTSKGPWDMSVMYSGFSGRWIFNHVTFSNPAQLADVKAFLQVEDTITLTPTGAVIKIYFIRTEVDHVIALFTLESGSLPATTADYTGIRGVQTTSNRAYYLVTKNALDTDFVVAVDTVEALCPTDKVVNAEDASFTIMDIDTERKELISESPIGMTLTAGDYLYLEAESRETLVWEDAPTLIQRAALPYTVDTSRMNLPTVPHPILAWLPTNAQGVSLAGPHDIEATLTALRIIGTGSISYTGSPDTGWVQGVATTRFVNWTDQLASAPAYLMPDTTPQDAPDYGGRTRVFLDWKTVHPVYQDIDWTPKDPATYNPGRDFATTTVCFDYSQFRRIIITNPTDSTASTLAEYRWNGSAWTGPTAGTWPLANCKVISAAPMIGVNATTGPVSPQGRAIVAACIVGGNYEVQIAFAGALRRVTVGHGLEGARIVTTAQGVWIVAKGGYGRITTDGTNVAVAWANVGGSGVVLLPNTFDTIDGTEMFCLGVAKGTTTDKEPKSITETRLFTLMPTPVADTNPVLRSERIIGAAPRLACMVKEPGKNRIVGLVGGRLFQVSATLPSTVERIRAVGMTGAELLEHLCQVLNCIAVPLPNGTIQIVGRVPAVGDSVTALSVDRVSVNQQRISENFFSVVRVSGIDGDSYSDAYGAVKGGRALEIDSQPAIWSEGGCFALASSYADFFGYPRRLEKHEWFFEDANGTPVWESILPWSQVTVTGSSRTWFLMGLSFNLVKGQAQATLLEKV